MKAESLDNFASLTWFAPELALTGAVLVIIVIDLLVRDLRYKTLAVIGICLAGLGYSALFSANALLGDIAPKNLFGGLMAFDDFANTFRILFAVVAAAILLCATLPPRAVVEEIVMTATHQRDVSEDLEVARRLGEPGYTPPR